MTEQHTADTEYQQPQHADIPYTLKPSPAAAINGTKPAGTPARPWPLAARLAVAVLIIGLATVAAGSLITLGRVSARATQASQQANSEAESVAAMRSQLAEVQAKIGTPVKPYRPPAIYQHYGVCVSFSRNTGNGDLVDVNLTSPQVVGGQQYGCNQGTFVSAVPAP